MTSRGGITVVAKISAGKKKPLAELLEAIDYEVLGGKPNQRPPQLPFRAIDTLHFARFVLLDDELVFTTSFDGSNERHYQDLGQLLPIGLDAIFRNCELYWNYTGPVSARLAAFLKDHDIGEQTHFVGAVDLTVRRIREDEGVRKTLRDLLDGIPADIRRGGPARVFQVLQDDFERTRLEAFHADKRLVSDAPRAPSPLKKLVYYGGGFARLAGAAAVLPPLAILFYPSLWQKEWTDAKRLERDAEIEDVADRAADRTDDDRRVRQRDRSDTRFATGQKVQKPLSHIVEIKPGITRPVALRVALAYVAFRAKYWDIDGDLAGIDSIHFARWLRLPGRRLLFFSDYDGSWESYIGDFVDEGASGLSAVWSNTVDFPKTKGLIAEGARDERGFKRWVRMNQLDTQVWYSAYPHLTVRRILDNETLRKALSRKMPSDEEAERWLALV